MEGIGREFMERTRHQHLGPSAQQRELPQPPLFVDLANGGRVALPDPNETSIGHIDLRKAIDRRRSLREYAKRPLTLEGLSFLLWSTQGVRKVVEDRATFRTVPSAGARHPFETVVLARRVEGLDVAFYQYAAIDHDLIELPSPPDATERLSAACYDQSMIAASAATFVWIADAARMTWRYGERGVRYIHLDAGHVCQNLYLVAESIGAGACAIGAFDDDAVNELLGLEDPDRFAVYLATVGLREIDG